FIYLLCKYFTYWLIRVFSLFFMLSGCCFCSGAVTASFSLLGVLGAGVLTPTFRFTVGICFVIFLDCVESTCKLSFAEPSVLSATGSEAIEMGLIISSLLFGLSFGFQMKPGSISLSGSNAATGV